MQTSTIPNVRQDDIIVQQKRPPDDLFTLPTGVVCIIADMLSFPDYLRCMRVCRTWYTFFGLLSSSNRRLEFLGSGICAERVLEYVEDAHESDLRIFSYDTGKADTRNKSHLVLSSLAKRKRPTLREIALAGAAVDFHYLSRISHRNNLKRVWIEHTRMPPTYIIDDLLESCRDTIENFSYVTPTVEASPPPSNETALPRRNLRTFPHLTHLRLSLRYHPTFPSRSMLHDLLRQCPHLKHLVLDPIDYYYALHKPPEPFDLAFIDQQCPQLTYFALRSCAVDPRLKIPSAASPSYAGPTCLVLEHTYFESATTLPILQRYSTSLQVLHLVRCRGIFLNADTIQFPALRELKLDNQHLKTSEWISGFAALLASSPHLEALSLHAVECAITTDVRKQIARLPRLSSLELVQYPHECEQWLIDLFRELQVPGLQVNFERVDGMTNAAFAALGSVDRLRSVCITACYITDPGMVAFLDNLKSPHYLKNLSIKLGHLSPEAVSHTMRRLPNTVWIGY
ncbi:hypothetical protein BCR43DRAFT_492947 [Syncephalastrum racemosum]|uniref:F-box domain-containing protein n=1 Tax=Syncephalastrum racemosum TaxID=13706 RepID=A0A1X2H9Q5_SYNRA|nr:hypothetical protein BCR43DRAFT_492947 [Syncephalastrum racemosum]